MTNDQFAKVLIQVFQIAGHYHCHIQGMAADNLHADIVGEDIPYKSEEFKNISHIYHNKFEKILKEIPDGRSIDSKDV